MGVCVAVFPSGFAWLLALLAAGILLRYTAAAALLGIASLPLLAWGLAAPPAVTWACAGMAVLTVVKRLAADWLALPRPGPARRRVLLRRLLLDRDTGAREGWVHRGPWEDSGG